MITKILRLNNAKNTLLFYTIILLGMKGYSQKDTMKLKPIISMEIESFSIGYGSPKSSLKRSPSYRSSTIFYYYLPIYKNYGVVPIVGYNFYYYYDKHITKDKYQTTGLFYGLGLEKRFKINENSNYGIGIQSMFYEQESKSYSPITAPVSKIKYSSNLWRLRITGNSQVYKRIGLTASINFVAYPKTTNYFISSIGGYRDINFSFGFIFTFKK
jgi:transglutaminase-like putative cysteine protease